VLEPRSAYVLRGVARWRWQHAISPTKALRYSITFRTMRDEARLRRVSKVPDASR
jgi:alkylated DNA repair dioxygenase AlkB